MSTKSWNFVTSSLATIGLIIIIIVIYNFIVISKLVINVSLSLQYGYPISVVSLPGEDDLR